MTTRFALDPRHGCHIYQDNTWVVTVLRSAPRAYREQVLAQFGHKSQTMTAAQQRRAERAERSRGGWGSTRSTRRA